MKAEHRRQLNHAIGLIDQMEELRNRAATIIDLVMLDHSKAFLKLSEKTKRSDKGLDAADFVMLGLRAAFLFEAMDFEELKAAVETFKGE